MTNQDGILMSTAPEIAGRATRSHHGVVTGHAIIGANVFRDIFASIRDIVGGRSRGYEKALSDARDEAMRDMAAEARERGANAIIAIDLDYETVGGSMLMVSASGTAVSVD